MGPVAAALLGAALIAAVPACAHAETGDTSLSSPDWETVNRVLEIPQVCASDGEVVTCKAPGLSFLAAGGGAALGGAQTARSEDTSTEEVSSVDDAGGAPRWGTLQDYENQAAGDGLVSAYVSARAVTLAPRRYAVPIRPVVPRARAFVPGRRPAIFGPRTSPWMLPSRMATGPAATPLVIPGRRGLP